MTHVVRILATKPWLKLMRSPASHPQVGIATRYHGLTTTIKGACTPKLESKAPRAWGIRDRRVDQRLKNIRTATTITTNSIISVRISMQQTRRDKRPSFSTGDPTDGTWPILL